MTHRQAALLGGVSAILLVIAVAATATVMTRRQDPQAPGQAAPAMPVAPTSTEPVAAASTSVATTTGGAPKPSSTAVLAHAFIAADLDSGTVLASRRSTDVWPLASLTKLMTAAVALERIPSDAVVTVVPVPGGNPSRPVLAEGEAFTMSDLLAVMLVASSNEAAESLAAYGGDRDAFIAAMNAKAAGWGLGHAVFADASGLSPGNKATAREVLEVARRVWTEHPEVFRYTRQPAVTVYAQGTGLAYTAYATHQLVRDPGFLGGKTGYTDEARGNLLTIVQAAAGPRALVVLGSEDRFGDTRRLRNQLTQTP